jgi:hypothetical protein
LQTSGIYFADLQRRDRSGSAQIEERFLQAAQDQIALAFRLDEFGVCFDMVHQLLLVPAHLEMVRRLVVTLVRPPGPRTTQCCRAKYKVATHNTR